MANNSSGPIPTRRPMAFLGYAAIAIAAALAVLPASFPARALTVAAGLVGLGGIVEILAGVSAGQWARRWLVSIGVTTIATGLALLLIPRNFQWIAGLVIAWLMVRATLLLVLLPAAPARSARNWILAGSIGNALLAIVAILMLMSVTIASLLFGSALRAPIFSVVPALSLLLAGLTFSAAGLGSSDRA